MTTMIPFIGCLYSSTTGRFGPPVSTSTITQTDLQVVNNNIKLTVVMNDINYMLLHNSDYTHVIVCVSFGFTPDTSDKQCMVSYDMAEQQSQTIQHITVNKTLDDIQVHSYSVLLTEHFVKVINNRASIKQQTDTKQVLFPNIQECIDNMSTMQTSCYITTQQINIISDLIKIIEESTNITVNKVERLLTELKPSNWVHTILQIVSTLKKFGETVKTKKEMTREIQEEILNRADMSKQMSGVGVEYLAAQRTIKYIITEQNNNDVFMLLFSKSLRQKNKEQEKRMFKKFMKLKKESKNNARFLAVDLDVIDEELPFQPHQTVICHVRNGCVLSHEYMKNTDDRVHDYMKNTDDQVHDMTNKIPDTQFTTKNFVLCHKFSSKNISFPNKYALLELPCPNETCSRDIKKWSCVYCTKDVIWGSGKNIYCYCGMGSLDMCKFKCCESVHGIIFQEYENEFLEYSLSKLKSKDEKCLLVIAQSNDVSSKFCTTVGYYLYSDDIHQAQEMKLKENNFNKTLCYNETILTMTECTYSFTTMREKPQNPTTNNQTSHPFYGVRQIQGNKPTPFESLVSNIISNRKTYNPQGICIIVKDSETKVQDKFQFYIKEVLASLHKSALNNIVFCLQCSKENRQNTCAMLETVLKDCNVHQLLEKDRIYYINNEAFDYMSLLNSKVIYYTDEQKMYFTSTWEESATEAARLINFVYKQEPHQLNQSVNLFKQREKLMGTLLHSTNRQDSQTEKSRLEYGSLMQEEALILCNTSNVDYITYLISQSTDANKQDQLKKRKVEVLEELNCIKTALSFLSQTTGITSPDKRQTSHQGTLPQQNNNEKAQIPGFYGTINSQNLSWRHRTN